MAQSSSQLYWLALQLPASNVFPCPTLVECPRIHRLHTGNGLTFAHENVQSYVFRNLALFCLPQCKGPLLECLSVCVILTGVYCGSSSELVSVYARVFSRRVSRLRGVLEIQPPVCVPEYVLGILQDESMSSSEKVEAVTDSLQIAVEDESLASLVPDLASQFVEKWVKEVEEVQKQKKLQEQEAALKDAVKASTPGSSTTTAASSRASAWDGAQDTAVKQVCTHIRALCLSACCHGFT